MKLNNIWLIILLLAAAFLVRLFPIDFPVFTSEEARVAFRGYTLATTGRDELGRSFPLFFNSLEDYQLPLVSYLTALGEALFGKTEFGARIPFILTGTALVFLTYLVGNFFKPSQYFRFTFAFIVATSPPLIFLSKIPNEAIILTFILTLLFYLLVSNKNLIAVIITMAAAVLVSKLAWFILLPFVFFTLIFFQKNFTQQKKLLLIISAGILVLVGIGLFFTNEQAKRSLLENNLPIFSDITIKNGINSLRGQGAQSGWPKLFDYLMFNKSDYLMIGLLHWLSHFNPAIYFGQFDSSGKMSYSFLGTFTKILIIPATVGLFFLLRQNTKNKLILSFILILTYPAIFKYPNLNFEAIVLTLPFMAAVIAFGLSQMNKRFVFLILFLAIIELIANIYILIPEYKNTVAIRPNWIKALVLNIFETSKNQRVAVSDDIVADIVPYIEWYTSFNPQKGFYLLPSPYKFRQYTVESIKVLGSEEKFTTCGKDEKTALFLSKRDLNKIEDSDINRESRVFFVKNTCIK